VAEIGVLRLKNMSDTEISDELNLKHFIKIPKSTISFLANRFYDYFAYTHYCLNSGRIMEHIEKHGGYVMHMDGTCEAGTDVIFSIIDGISGIILVCEKMKTENKKDIVRMIDKCIKTFGCPLGVVSDLSSVIISAINEAVPGNIPRYICQFHFLENIGSAIFKTQYNNLLRFINSGKLKAQMQSLRRDLASKHSKKLLTNDELISLMEDPCLIGKYGKTETARSLALVILRWIIDYKHELNGEYFPFSRPEYEFLVRCKSVFEILKRLFEKGGVKKKHDGTMHTIYEKLKLFFSDIKLQECMEQIERQTAVFNDVRTYLRMQHLQGTPLVRQKADVSGYLGKSVSPEMFIAEIRDKYKTDAHYEKIIDVAEKYFRNYRNQLLGHHIKNKNDEYIDVSRTNNTMEFFHGEFKHGLRKRIGNANLKRLIHYMHPGAIIAQNLLNEEYKTIVGCCDREAICKMFYASEKNSQKGHIARETHTSHTSFVSCKTLRQEKFLVIFEATLKRTIDFPSRVS